MGSGGILEYTPNSYIYAGEEQTSNDNSIGGFFYENSFKGILNEENVKNVYNSAIWNFDDNASSGKSDYNKYDYLTQGFTTITILKGNTQFVINQNEFGKSLYDYNVTNLSETESYLDRLNLEAYYGMFMTLSADDLQHYENNLGDLFALLGIDVPTGESSTNISLDNLSKGDYYKFVGFTDSKTESNKTKRTLNFEKCDNIIWTASSTAFSTLAFEANMKI